MSICLGPDAFPSNIPNQLFCQIFLSPLAGPPSGEAILEGRSRLSLTPGHGTLNRPCAKTDEQVVGVTCPKCHFQQDSGEECLRCGIIFRKYKPLPPPSTGTSASTSSPADHPSPSPPLHEPLRLQPDQAEETPAPEADEAWEDDILEDPRPRRGVGWLKRTFRIFPWLSLAGMIGVFYLILQEAPPLRIKMDPQALARVDHKMQELQVAAQRGQPYTLNLDEAELNAWLQANLALSQGPAPQQVSGLMPTTNAPVDDPKFRETQGAMKDLRVNLVGDTVRAYAVFRLYGQDVSLLLEGRVLAESGYLRFIPTDARIGSLPLPSVTLDRVAKRLFDSPESRDSFQLSPHISTVDIRRGRLFVAFR